MADYSNSMGAEAKSTKPTVGADELAVLRAIVEGTAQTTGDDFFRALVRNLSIATGVSSAFIAEFSDSKTRVRTLAFWMDGEYVGNRQCAGDVRQEKSTCHTNAKIVRFGGRLTPTRAAKELDALLERRTERKPTP